MSFVLAAPAALEAAASDIAGIGSSINAANAAAAVPTTGILAAAADEVSAQVAALFSTHGHGYQQLSAQMVAFHDRFVQTLNSGACQYAATEASAVQNLVSAVNAPVQQLLGQPVIGGGATAVQNVVSNAVSRFQSILPTGGFGALRGNIASAFNQAGAGALALRPTGGASALAAASALLRPAASAAILPPPGTIGYAIEQGYLLIEPYVRYGFELAQYAAGWVPYVGWLSGQILIFYDLFEPIVQSGLFNIVDWLGGYIPFGQGLNNFIADTAASINRFINSEINFFLPPLPPLP